MSIFNQIQHLLPTGRAWRVIIDKPFRRLLEGISNGLSTDVDANSTEMGGNIEMGDGSEMARPFVGVREYYDAVYLDHLPETTTSLAEYEAQFGLVSTGTDAERRQRLAAAWAAQGGQSPKYIQDVVQANGFDVYIHDWWAPGTNNPRDPNAFIPDNSQQLVNKRSYPAPFQVVYGGGGSFGESAVYYGAIGGTQIINNLKPIPTDPAKWRFFVYFGGETFGDYADVPAERRDEFEALLLKLCPTQLWIGTRINYT